MTELISVRPDAPMSEVWQWDTDVMVSRNGTEQRVDNSPIPRRTIGGDYVIHSQALITQLMMGLAAAKGLPLHAPFFQYQTNLTALASIGATSVSFVARRTELRDGDLALIFDDDDIDFELVEIDTVSSSSATLVAPTTKAWPAGSRIAPVHLVYAGSGLVLSRRRADGIASISLNLREVGFHDPFVNPFNDTAADLYSTKPALRDAPIGNDFEEEYLSGSKITDFGGIIDIESPWTRSKNQFVRRWYCRRLMVPAEFEKWFAFAQLIRGSQKPFWLPSFRQDYTIITPPAPSGNQMTLAGHFFRDYCFPYVGLKSFFIESDGGLHLCTATARTDLGANDRVTFSPALPAGVAYSANQKIGILHHCRLSDGRMIWQHFNSHSILEMSMISTDQ